jgi:hypothetical protein
VSAPIFCTILKDAGYGNLSAHEIVQLRIHGVDTAFAEDGRALGYGFTPEQLVQLRIHGVDGGYLPNSVTRIRCGDPKSGNSSDPVGSLRWSWQARRTAGTPSRLDSR